MTKALHWAILILIIPAFFLMLPSLGHAGEIRGKVVSVFHGEPLRQARVSVKGTHMVAITAADGSFKIEKLAAGKYTLQVSVVGYRLVEVLFALAEGEDVREFSITMAPVNFRRTEVVEVKGDIFQGANPA